ncbi:hypothetical protein FOE78_19085 [Microlunatus elymi]|uniref:Secreted protein n=1 Tax=Microlunatus elymi TaxID=2596828 RepID=A0A516Q2T2_9ACTN|nr:hypothetical protein [Microlunatus elymi]QDP97734.1 hypothetical protein FOE78_19085 [Microlunatus elymi]
MTMMKSGLGIKVCTAVAASAVGIAMLTAGTGDKVHSLDAQSLVPELARAQSAGDALPDTVQPLIDDASLDPGTVRLLAESRLGFHWVSEDALGDICSITMGREGVSAANCLTPQQFYSSGSSLMVAGSSRNGVVSHLLPAGTDASAVKAAIERRSSKLGQSGTEPRVEVLNGGSLVVMDEQTAKELGDITISRNDGTDIVLSGLEH